MENEEKQPFLTHLEELRDRLIHSAIAVGVGFVICYIFSDTLFGYLVKPLQESMPEGDRMIYTALPEMFFTYVKTAFVAGLLLTSPYIFYQVWLFIAPGLYRKEKKLVFPFVFFSTILFVGGALFGYFIVFPFGFKFFMGFANEYIQAMPSVKQYFSFAIKLLIAFGLVFELPVIIYFLTRLGLVTTDFLKKKRKYAILLTFVMAAVLTPPDVVTQTMMAFPLIILYEVGIIVSRLAVKKRASEEKEEAPAEDGEGA